MFEPLTFGYEWETFLLKPNMMPLENKEVKDTASLLRNRLPWCRTGLDIIPYFGVTLLELRSGILEGWDELVERTESLIEKVTKICKKKNWVFLPGGTHPAYGGALGLHTHIGSVHNYSDATFLANAMTPYIPALAALMANSPVWASLSGEYKSYRILRHADRCSVPRRISDPDFAYGSWGDDTSVKIGSKPTIELRIADGSSFPSIACEYIAFSSSFLFGLAETKVKLPTKEDYIESNLNRWRAAKDGLQSTFIFKGRRESVCDILGDMLKIAQPNLARIGCRELKLIPMMLEKRQTQADMQSLIFKQTKDSHSFSRQMANILKDTTAFEKYLKMAPVLEALELLNIEEFILSKIGIETPYKELYDLLRLPHNILQDRLNLLEKKGRIKIEMTPEKGELYTKI